MGKIRFSPCFFVFLFFKENRCQQLGSLIKPYPLLSCLVVKGGSISLFCHWSCIHSWISFFLIWSWSSQYLSFHCAQSPLASSVFSLSLPPRNPPGILRISVFCDVNRIVSPCGHSKRSLFSKWWSSLSCLQAASVVLHSYIHVKRPAKPVCMSDVCNLNIYKLEILCKMLLFHSNTVEFCIYIAVEVKSYLLVPNMLTTSNSLHGGGGETIFLSCLSEGSFMILGFCCLVAEIMFYYTWSSHLGNYLSVLELYIFRLQMWTFFWSNAKKKFPEYIKSACW